MRHPKEHEGWGQENKDFSHTGLTITCCDCKDGYYFALGRLLGNGIGTVIDHETWKPKRKIYDPAFNKR